jgi:hypothetical protein
MIDIQWHSGNWHIWDFTRIHYEGRDGVAIYVICLGCLSIAYHTIPKY